VSSPEIVELFKKYVIANYNALSPVCLARGEGSWVWDVEGRR